MDENVIYIPTLNLDSILTFFYRLLVGGSLQNQEEIVDFWKSFYSTYSYIAMVVSFFILVGIVYALIRVYQIRTRENEAIKEAAAHYQAIISGGEKELAGTSKWRQVELHAASENAPEKRLAILEADIILDELVYEHFGPLGETLGERLKKVDRSDFQTIDKAWEAHRIRNAIAHEGSKFELSDRELRNILKLYEEVFREFNYI